MKICYLGEINNLHMRRWANAFAAMGHEVLVLSDSTLAGEGRLEAGVEVATARWKPWELVWAFKVCRGPYANNRWKHLALRRALGDFKPDLVHGMEALDYGSAAIRLLGDRGPPRIVMPWGTDVLHLSFEDRRARSLVLYGLERAEHIVGNMPNLAEYLEETFGLPRHKVTGFGWGADLGTFRPGRTRQAQALRARLGIPDNARVVLSPRNFSRYWGTETIVEAVAEIAARKPEAFFVFLAGPGCDRALMARQRRRLDDLKCGERTLFIEEVIPPCRLAALFNLADVFVSIPRNDFLAVTVLEGMACGCVPVCRKIRAYEPRIEEGATGRYVPEPLSAESLARVVCEMLSDAQGLEKMSRAAACQARELDDRRLALRKMAEVYARVTGRDEFLQNAPEP